MSSTKVPVVLTFLGTTGEMRKRDALTLAAHLVRATFWAALGRGTVGVVEDVL